MKTLIAAVVTAAILAGPAYAQMAKNNNTGPSPQQLEKAAKAERERAEIEKEYNDTMNRMKSQGPAPKSDPWARLRPRNSADPKRQSP